MSRRDDATVRASMRAAEDAASRVLRTREDYQRLPGVRGVEVDERERRVTIYVEQEMPAGVLEHLQADVDDRREINALVVWKMDRRVPRERRQ